MFLFVFVLEKKHFDLKNIFLFHPFSKKGSVDKSRRVCFFFKLSVTCPVGQCSCQ